MMKKLALFSLAGLLAACAAAPTETEVSTKLIGMPRAELLTCMPEPEALIKEGDTESLRFSRSDDYMGLRYRCAADVRLKSGRVDELRVDASAAGMYGVKSNICRALLRKCMAN
jgi:hypothetical protein